MKSRRMKMKMRRKEEEEEEGGIDRSIEQWRARSSYRTGRR